MHPHAREVRRPHGEIMGMSRAGRDSLCDSLTGEEQQTETDADEQGNDARQGVEPFESASKGVCSAICYTTYV